MKRVPTEPIAEKEATNTGYTNNDRNRNSNAGGNALANRRGMNSGEGRSYKYEPRTDDETSATPVGSEICPPVVEQKKGKIGIPKNFVHKCEGCASGVCKSRYLPKSLIHDVSDGNTVSTSASVMTNSSVDKNDFIDRDQDFTGFELDEEEWIQV